MLVGILIIAFAVMVVPVMGDDVSVTGDTSSTFHFEVINQSLDFGTFIMGTNYISPSYPDTSATPTFAVVNVTTNDAAWTISQAGLNNGKMTQGSNTLAAALGIKNASVISGTTTGQTSPLALTGGTVVLFSGTPIDLTYIPLELSQVVSTTDPYAIGYTNTITFTYTDTS